MNHVSKILSLALLAAAPALSWAEQTNLVQELTIQLAGIEQGGSMTNRNQATTALDFTSVGTREVIQAVGNATGNTFGRTAKLVVLSPLPSGPASVQVREGSRIVDVSSYFVMEQQSDALVSSTLNLRTGRASGTYYSLQHFVLQDSPYGGPGSALHFDVRGIGADNAIKGDPAAGSDTAAEVNGVASRNGALLLLQGTIRIQGHALELSNDSQPPPS